MGAAAVTAADAVPAAEVDALLALPPVPARDGLWGMDVADAVRTVRARPGRTRSDMTVARQLELARVALERVHRYADSCVRVGMVADPAVVLRLAHSCDDEVMSRG